MEVRVDIAIVTMMRLIFEQRALVSGFRYSRGWFIVNSVPGVWFVSGRAAFVLPHLHALVALVRRGDATPSTVGAWLDFTSIRVRFVPGATVPDDFDVASDVVIRVEMTYDEACIASRAIVAYIDDTIGDDATIVRTLDDARHGIDELVARYNDYCYRCNRHITTTVVCNLCSLAHYCSRACCRADIHHACEFLTYLKTVLDNYASSATIAPRMTAGYEPPSSST